MKIIPKKRYGQHFLRDTGTIERIAGFIKPSAADVMVEVGAGDGVLSIILAPKVLRLLAIEIDRDILPALASRLEPYPNAEVIRQNVLKIDLPVLLSPHIIPGARLRIVGNLPYNIGTAIIEKFLATQLPVTDMTFLLQLETVERMSAIPGSGEYGFFSVFCQHHCDVTRGFKVSPACFVPRPKVYSAMITLRPREGPRDQELEDHFLMITKAAFAYRRKKLANSLSRHEKLGPIAGDLLSRAALDGARRAQDITVPEYERLALIYNDLALRHHQSFRPGSGYH